MPAYQSKTFGKWEVLKKGVLLQRLWSKNEWPQVAVLKLSAAAFATFEKNPAKFINSNMLFPQKVQTPAGPGVSVIARSPNQPALLIIAHKKASRAPWISLPEEIAE